MSIETYTGTLSELERVDTSRNGNPRYRLTIVTSENTSVSCQTRPDSSLGYSVGNFRGDRVTVQVGTYRGKYVLTGIEGAKPS